MKKIKIKKTITQYIKTKAYILNFIPNLDADKRPKLKTSHQ